MANSDSNTNMHEPMFADCERGLIALKASWEIEALAKYVASELGQRLENKDLDDGLLVLKGVVMRIKALNSVIMGAVGDGADTLVSLNERLG